MGKTGVFFISYVNPMNLDVFRKMTAKRLARA